MALFRPAEVTTAAPRPPKGPPAWYGKFMSNVQRGPTVNDCWIWTGGKSRGYGVFCYGGKWHRAHRWSCVQFNGGYIPPGLSVLHQCDDPSCVNPLHLRIGTQQENNRERDVRNRVAHGEHHFRAKLTAEQVREIRAAFGNSDELAAKMKSLAAQFGVSAWAILKIITRETWGRT